MIFLFGIPCNRRPFSESTPFGNSSDHSSFHFSIDIVQKQTLSSFASTAIFSKKEDIWLWLSWFHIKMGDKRKMDKPRALSLMGFSTSRPIGKIFFLSWKKKLWFHVLFFQMHILVNLKKYGKFWIKLFLKELNKWCMAPKRKLRNKTSKWRKSKVMLHELNFEFFHHKKLPNSFKSSNSTPVLLWTIQKKFSTLG